MKVASLCILMAGCTHSMESDNAMFVSSFVEMLFLVVVIHKYEAVCAFLFF